MVLSAAALSATSANAQDLQDQEIAAEEIIVTGSRIARDEFSSASPISVFDAEEYAAQGVTSVDEFLKTVPAFTGFQLGNSTNNGNGAGQKQVDLRGLSPNRTLVLFNGRRQVGDATGNGAVDLNSVPAAMIERVEVLKDGASTAYGSDAIAGVVNIILKDDFEGVQISADYGAGLDNIDAENYTFSILAGASTDRGNVTFGFEYNRQRELVQAQREFAQDELQAFLNGDGTGFEAIAAGSANSRLIRNVPGLPGGLFILDEETGQARPFDFATDTYNFAPVNALTQPNERFQFTTIGHYDLFESNTLGTVEGYFETSYTHRGTQQRLAPDASFSVDGDFQGSGLGNAFVPASNPFNPFGDNAAGPDGVLGTSDDLNPFGISGVGVTANRRFVESGGRLTTPDGNTWRIVGGLRGQFNDNLDWDFSYTYARDEFASVQRNNHNLAQFRTLVDPDLCSADPDCPEVFNPFLFDTLTEEQAEFLFVPSITNRTIASLSDFNFSVSGDTAGLVEIAGEAIGFAAGYERRKENGSFLPDQFASSGLTTGGAAGPLSGSFTVNEYFLETVIPIVRDLPFAQAIDIEAAARHSKYSTSAGKTTNYRVGLNYTVDDNIRFRGTFATGFRAPNISELNTTTSASFPAVENFCEFLDRRNDVSDTVRTNCLALGADPGDGSEIGDIQILQITTADAAALQPEESETFTLGVVITPTFLPGLSVSVDYWNIEVTDLIGTAAYESVALACLESTGLSADECDLFDGGVPYDGLFPTDLNTQFGNLGTLETDGIDFDVSYNADVQLGWITGVHATMSGVWTNSREEAFDIGEPIETVGTATGFAIFPEWRINTSVGVSGDNFKLSWDTRYISGTDSRYRPAEITDDARAEAVLYNDIVGTVDWDRYSFTVGINNLFDVEPPRFDGAFNANTEPGFFDVIGRRLFVNAKVNF
jgi:iron complex outermembrane receptor protein